MGYRRPLNGIHPLRDRPAVGAALRTVDSLAALHFCSDSRSAMVKRDDRAGDKLLSLSMSAVQRRTAPQASVSSTFNPRVCRSLRVWRL